MKFIMKGIEAIVWFNEEGDISPIRFKIKSEESDLDTIINVDRIIKKSKERYAGNTMIVFECQSQISDTLKQYQLKYEVEKQKWFLYKM